MKPRPKDECPNCNWSKSLNDFIVSPLCPKCDCQITSISFDHDGPHKTVSLRSFCGQCDCYSDSVRDDWKTREEILKNMEEYDLRQKKRFTREF